MRHWMAALLGALVLVAGCGTTVAPVSPNTSTQTTATVVASAFLLSTVVSSTATVVPPTPTVAPPTETAISATSTTAPAAIVATPGASITPQPTTPPATATPAPVPTRPRPSATRVPTVHPATPAGVTFLAVKGAKPGQTASVSIQTAPGATCSIAYSTTHGTDSVPTGLVPKKADSQGRVSWAWLIGTRTIPGIGSVIVTCGGASASANIVIG